MELRVIGCDGSYPSAQGACSGYLITTPSDKRVLLDCGSGVLPKLMAMMDPALLDAVVITHWHNDHASDMLTLRYYLQIHEKRLKVYAPATDQALRSLCVCDEFDLRDICRGFTLDDLQMSAVRVEHSVPAYAVKLSSQKRRFVYTGDVSSFDNLLEFTREVDMLLCDASFTDGQWQPDKPHLSARLAGRLGTLAAVKQLLLTHCQPNNDWQTLQKEAQQEYAQARFVQAGHIYPL